MIMHVLVTGVTGFIGTHLTRRLLNEGYQVTGISRQESPELEFVDRDGFELVTADLCSEDLNMVLPEDIDIVYHYAAMVSGDRQFAEYLQGNVLATHNLFEYAAERATKFVQASTGSVYSWESDDLYVDENTREEPHSEYGLSKYLADTVVRSQAPQNSVSGCILRYPVVYGSGRSQNFVGDLYRKAIKGEKISLPTEVAERRIDAIHIEDVVRANISIIDCDPASLDGELFLVASGNSRKIGDIVRSIVRKTGSDSEVVIEDDGRGSLPNIYWDVSKAVDELGISETGEEFVR